MRPFSTRCTHAWIVEARCGLALLENLLSLDAIFLRSKNDEQPHKFVAFKCENERVGWKWTWNEQQRVKWNACFQTNGYWSWVEKRLPERMCKWMGAMDGKAECQTGIFRSRNMLLHLHTLCNLIAACTIFYTTQITHTHSLHYGQMDDLEVLKPIRPFVCGFDGKHFSNGRYLS